MKKRVLKTITSLFLSVAMMGAGVTSVPAAVSREAVSPADPVEESYGALGTMLIEHAINIAIEDGFAAAGLAATGIASSTDSEELKEIASFVSSWVLGNKTDDDIKKLEELCEEILAEVKLVDQHLGEYTTMIEGMLADQNINDANNTRNQTWKHDVEDYFSEYNVSAAYDAYTAYMKAASEAAADPAKEKAYEAAENRFYQALLLIYRTRVPGEENFEEKAMTTSVINDILFGDINNMCRALSSDKGNFTEASAKLAHLAYAFSADEYQYVYASMSEQILTITNLLMMYQDLCGRQSAYIYANYQGDALSAKEEELRKWVNQLATVNLSFQQSLDQLLSSPIALDIGISQTLDQYMRPEEAVEAVLQNTNYTNRVDYDYWWSHEPSIRKITATEEDFDELWVKGDASYPLTTTPYMTFLRTGVNTGNGVKTFYILDGTKIPVMKMLAMDYKHNRTFAVDLHFPSADYYNTVRGSFTDGFGIWSLDQDGDEAAKLFTLFNNNFFRSSQCSSRIGPYLKDYVGYAEDNAWYLMMPEMDYDCGYNYATSYEIFSMVDPNTAIPGSSLVFTDISAGEFQSNGKQKDARYVLILPSVQEEFEPEITRLSCTSPEGQLSEISFLTEDGKEVDSLESASGSKATLLLKAEKGFSVELRLDRYDDASDRTRVTSSQVICGDVVDQMIPREAKADDSEEFVYYEIPCRVPFGTASYAIRETCSGEKPIGDDSEEETVYVTKGVPYAIPAERMKDVSSLEITPAGNKNIKVNKKTGAVTVQKAGSCELTLHYSGGKKDQKIRVVTDVPKAVKKIVCNLDPISARALVSGANHTDLAFESSKPEVALILGDLIVPKKPGTTTISMKYGGKTLRATLKILQPKLSRASYSMKMGTEKENLLRIKNSDAAVLSWSSDHPEILSVDPNTGKLTALSKGKAGITAHLSDGMDVGPCVVTVK